MEIKDKRKDESSFFLGDLHIGDVFIMYDEDGYFMKINGYYNVVNLKTGCAHNRCDGALCELVKAKVIIE